MARTEMSEMEELQQRILLLEAELERLNTPPYSIGTVMQLGKETLRIAMEGGQFIETILPPKDGPTKELRAKLKTGARVTLNGGGVPIGYSEFPQPIGGDIVTVDEILPQGRARIQVNGEPQIVRHELKGLKKGDEVQLDSTGHLAVERFDRKRTRYALEEIPQAPWDDIGGLETTIGHIREEIEEPYLHRKVFARYGRKPAKGILLYGPPGCGKTMIAKSIAYNLAKLTGNGQGHFISIKGPEILNKFIGNSEENIRRIYAAARESAQETGVPTIVFIDEAESVMKARGTGISTDVYDSIVPQFLAEMDGMEGNAEVVTVLATNREDIIDPAILRDGRVDRRIRVPRPDRKGAEAIFKIYLKSKPIAGARPVTELITPLTKEIYNAERVAYRVHAGNDIVGHFNYANLVSGAMIKGIVDRGCTNAIRREISGGKKGLAKEDLVAALNQEIAESTGFNQSIVKDDWESAFGARGQQLYAGYKQGYVRLEKAGTTEE